MRMMLSVNQEGVISPLTVPKRTREPPSEGKTRKSKSPSEKHSKQVENWHQDMLNRHA